MPHPTASVAFASDRGPFTFVRDGDQLRPESRPGSLVDVLYTGAEVVDGRVAWISTTTSDLDVEAQRSGHFERLWDSAPLAADPVFIEPATYRDYYEEAGVRMLWFAHHNLWGDLPDGPGADPATFGAYQAVNDKLARRVARWCGPDTLVVLHDYQLGTAPLALRRLVPQAPIAHFHHTPFASPDSLEHLPKDVAPRLLLGLLAADLLGFQRRAWADDFLACCSLVGAEVDWADGLVCHGGHVTWVRCYPTPIDAATVRERSSTENALDWADRVRQPEDVSQIVRVDRLDPAKNVLRGFQAFELLLERRADLRTRVSFTAFMVPSREGVAEYRSYAERTWQQVDRINARFPGTVRVHYGNDIERALGAMRSYDVLLVNSLRDGMNLVALEGPAVNKRDGCVVLSGEAGAADVLCEGALLLEDPTDIVRTSEVLEQALSLPLAERRRRAQQLRLAAMSRRPADWVSDQLVDLRTIHNGGTPCRVAW